MRIPGPYSDDNWDWLSQDFLETASASTGANRPGYIIWEIGLVLLVALGGSGAVTLLLRAFHITAKVRWRVIRVRSRFSCAPSTSVERRCRGDRRRAAPPNSLIRFQK